MVKLLFCLRAFNDVDNIAPAIFFYMKRYPDQRVALLFYQYYDWRTDANIAFLLEEFGERVTIIEPERFLGNRPSLRRGGGLAGQVLDHFERRFLPAKSVHNLFRPSERFASVRRRFFGELRQRFPDLRAAVFDQNRHHEIGGALETLREEGVRTLALPVSPLISYNTLRTIGDVSRDLTHVEHSHSYGGFDRICFTDRLYVEYLRRHYLVAGTDVPFLDRIAYVGAIRYSPEWLAARPTRPATLHHPTERRRLAFFLSQPKNNVNWSEVLRTLDLLAAYESEIEVVLKPHTRPQRPPPGVPYNFFKRRLIFPEHGNVTIAYDHPSSGILDWAEAVMFWSTSVAIEAYLEGKVCINLNHLHGNRTVFADYDLPYQTYCRDDLKFLLEELCQGTLHPSRMSTPFERFRQEIIHGGVQTTVPEAYLDELVSISS